MLNPKSMYICTNCASVAEENRLSPEQAFLDLVVPKIQKGEFSSAELATLAAELGKAGVPLTDYKRIGRVRGWWFDRMKFAPIIFLRSFRSHCPTVGPNLTLAIENYLRSSDQSLTLQTTTDYLRLLFSPDASSPTARFFIRFSIRSSDYSGNGTPA